MQTSLFGCETLVQKVDSLHFTVFHVKLFAACCPLNDWQIKVADTLTVSFAGLEQFHKETIDREFER